VRGITIHFLPAAGEASIYVLMFLVLLFRPRGLLGERIENSNERTGLYSKLQPLLIAALALIALPFVMRLFGLTVNTASMVVILTIATMGLNLCVGYTGLVSFGHGAWFGIGAYAAGIIQNTGCTTRS